MSTKPDNNPRPRISRRWKRGEPGQLNPENRDLFDELEDLITEEQREDVLRAVRGWAPADVMELLILLPLAKARRLYGWLPPGPAEVEARFGVPPERLHAMLAGFEAERTFAL